MCSFFNLLPSTKLISAKICRLAYILACQQFWSQLIGVLLMLGLKVECLSTLYKFIIHLPIQCIHINYHIHNIYRVSGNLFSLEVATHVSSCSLNQVSITTGYELVAISTPYRYKMVYIYTRKREAPDDIFSLTGTQQQALKKNPHSTPC